MLRQVAFYLDDEKVQALKDLKWRTGRSQQALIREGLELVFAKYGRKRGKPSK